MLWQAIVGRGGASRRAAVGDSEAGELLGVAGIVTPQVRRVLDAGARLVGLPPWRGYSGPTWLEGLVLAESGADPRVVRYERHLDQGDADAPSIDDGVREDDKSYGLMQVLGSNLRAMTGVPPTVVVDYSWALYPMANLAFGLRFLHGLLQQANFDIAEFPNHSSSPLYVLEGPVDLALARYNGGPRGNSARDWPALRNRSYVDRVARHAEVARESRRRRNWMEAV